MGLGFGLLGCPTPEGEGDGDPEPEMMVIQPDPSPWREDFDTAFDALDPAMQMLAEPVPEEGGFAGTFGMFSVSASLVDTGIAGTFKGGGTNLRLLVRTWDEETRQYQQRSELCGGENFEVSGVTTGVAPEVYRQVVPSENEVVRVDPNTGVLLSDGHVQLWGLQDLPDIYTTPLPTTIEESEMDPWPARIWDMEEDGQPGITLFVDGMNSAGTVQGVIYAIQRKKVNLSGVTMGPDRSVGWVSTSWEQLALGSMPDLLQYIYGGSADVHPDPDESWFDMLRMPDGSTCDDVLTLREEGAFAEEGAPW